jgi:putative transposase
MKKPKASSKKLPKKIAEIVKSALKPVKLFFQDESRFGRISQAIGCWAPVGHRPIVPSQIVREYTYAYTAACPLDGETFSLILPDMSTQCLNLFLKKLARRYRDYHLILVFDGAPSHCANKLMIPENISLIPLPSYSPELNPVENFWKELKKHGFYNQVFSSLSQVEDRLEAMLKYFYNHPQLVQSIVAYPWILSALN